MPLIETFLTTVKIRISALYPISASGSTCLIFSINAPSPVSAPLPRRIPISASENLLYKLLSLRHLWKEAPNTLSLQLFLDQQ